MSTQNEQSGTPHSDLQPGTEQPTPAALSDTPMGQDQPQAPAAPAAPESVAPAPVAPAPTPAPAAPAGASSSGLPTFLKISIILLAALSIAAISLLFIGDFEGKFERIFSTFLAFAIFVSLTAFDTRRGLRNEWYPPVALLANSYILALLLIVIWMTPSGWSLVWDIFWKSLVVIIATRAVVACAQVLLHMAENRPKPLGVFAMITSLLATVTGILFTAPIAIEVFNVEIPELYWRFAVAALLLTGLGLSIALLLRWSYGSADREAARRARDAARATAVYPYQAQGFPAAPAALQPGAPGTPGAQPYGAEVPASAPMGSGLAQAGEPAAQELLPWPTYPDGRPLPIGADGQPDFGALNR